jgi:hypothetical protein
MRCRTFSALGVCLVASALAGCGEPNPGPPGSTKGGSEAGLSVQFPFGPPKNRKAPRAAKKAAGKTPDTSQFPPK